MQNREKSLQPPASSSVRSIPESDSSLQPDACSTPGSPAQIPETFPRHFAMAFRVLSRAVPSVPSHLGLLEPPALSSAPSDPESDSQIPGRRFSPGVRQGSAPQGLDQHCRPGICESVGLGELRPRRNPKPRRGRVGSRCPMEGSSGRSFGANILRNARPRVTPSLVETRLGTPWATTSGPFRAKRCSNVTGVTFS